MPNREIQKLETSIEPCLSVIMPVFNEEASLSEIVLKVLEIPCLLELIIVDNFSNDSTSEIARSLADRDPRIKYVRQPKNFGKTESLKTGFAMAAGEIIIVQDADLEYEPAEISDVIRPILLGQADVVFGSRYMLKRMTRVHYFSHYLANKGLTFLSNCFTNMNLTDVNTCYKAFRREIICNMVISSSSFGFEIEAVAKVAKLKCVVYEVPISYYGRTYDEGKKIGFTDGLIFLWYIVKYNLLTTRRNSYAKDPKEFTKMTRD